MHWRFHRATQVTTCTGCSADLHNGWWAPWWFDEVEGWWSNADHHYCNSCTDNDAEEQDI